MIPMKMFPHAFVPFFPVLLEADSSKRPVRGKPPEALHKQNQAISHKPLRIDVEKAVDVMLAAGKVRNDGSRQQCRLDLIKALPVASIDWETVDWVQACPFQTARH